MGTARQIWEFAEVGYQETRSSALLQDQLRAAGFAVESGVADMPPAFVATWGSGSPVVAIIGEFATRGLAGFVDRLIHRAYVTANLGRMATFERASAKLDSVIVLRA